MPSAKSEWAEHGKFEKERSLEGSVVRGRTERKVMGTPRGGGRTVRS